MAKICINQIYRQVYDRQEESILLAKSSGSEVVKYTIESFGRDMRANDLIGTTKTIKEKWDALVANDVILDSRGKYPTTWGFLYIPALEIKVLGHTTCRSKRECARVRVEGVYIPESAALEGSE